MPIPWRFLAGTTLVLLLPGGVSTTTAAVPADTPAVPAEFTARSMGTSSRIPGHEFGDDFIAYRGLTETGTIPESSDARFSGTRSWTGNRDQYSDPVGS